MYLELTIDARSSNSLKPIFESIDSFCIESNLMNFLITLKDRLNSFLDELYKSKVEFLKLEIESAFLYLIAFI